MTYHESGPDTSDTSDTTRGVETPESDTATQPASPLEHSSPSELPPGVVDNSARVRQLEDALASALRRLAEVEGQQQIFERSVRVPRGITFSGDRRKLDLFLFQLEAHMVLEVVKSDSQKLGILGLCLQDSPLDWWMVNHKNYGTWEEARQALQDYYGDHYKADRAHEELLQVRQTGGVQDFLVEIDTLNGSAGLPQPQLIQIILPRLKPGLRRHMRHYEDLRDRPEEWRKKLLTIGTHLDYVNESILRDRNQSNNKRSAPTASNPFPSSHAETPRNPMDVPSDIPAETLDRRGRDRRCKMCGTKGHYMRDCTTGWRASTPPPRDNAEEKPSTSTEPPAKRVRIGTAKPVSITDLGSEDDE